MPGRFYEVVKLTAGSDCVFDDRGISIALDPDALKVVTDDWALEAARSEESVFWVGGGGSIVIGGRYVPLVRRGPTGINASRLSLFTGRSSGRDEWVSPRLMVRELFEEMVIFNEERPLRPAVGEYQQIVDAAWRDLCGAGVVDGAASGAVALIPLPLPSVKVEVRWAGESHRDQLCCHVNSRKDVNVLFAFAADLDPRQLSARDGEFHRVDGRVVLHNRTVVLYDAWTGTARPISMPGAPQRVSPDEMTEHLQAFLTALNLRP